LEGVQQQKKSPETPGNALSNRQMSRFSKICGWRRKNRCARFFETALCEILIYQLMD